MFLKTFLFLIFNINLIYSREICYGDLGCFTDSYPFSGSLARPIAFLPDKPEKISTKFTLFNRNTASLGEVITADSIGASFNPNIGTKFIIHGFVQHSFVLWVTEMKNAILSVENVNVITGKKILQPRVEIFHFMNSIVFQYSFPPVL